MVPMLRNRPVAAGSAIPVALVALAALAVSIVLRPAAGPAPSATTASPTTASPTTSSGSFDSLGVPSRVDGLPVRSVVEALSLRDAGSPDRIAVFGWGVRFLVPCPMAPDAFQPLEDCVYHFTWLMAGPEDLWTANPDGSSTLHPPVGPAFNLTDGPPEAGAPQAIVFIGRFHDPRAALCPAGDRRAACDRLFIVEGTFWTGPVASPQPPPSTLPIAPSVPTASGG